MSPGASARPFLESIYRQAVAAVDAGDAVRRAIVEQRGQLSIAGRPLAPQARIVLIAVGKAAAAMARAVEEVAGARIARGVVITRDGHGLPLERLPLRETGHPVPDARGEAAAREAHSIAAEADGDDVLLVLLSGGASALMACPPDGVDRADLEATTRALLAGGVDIHDMNCVRKHLSAVAGGRLALAAVGREIEVLAVSDVPGDGVDVIGSGPWAPDPTTWAQALSIAERPAVAPAIPRAIRDYLVRGARGEVGETPKPGDPRLARVRHHIVARNADARAAARAASDRLGVHCVDLGEVLRGEARHAGVRLAALARALRGATPSCVVAGGETTVTLRGDGRGGRSQELALAAAIELAGTDAVGLLAAGTDGSDGPTDAVGAFADGGTVARAAALGRDARHALARNDSHGFFVAEGGLLRTGPTHTNVMDLALMAAGEGWPEGEKAD